ncbi:uncharacterized protein VTP21DRAFT_1832 [Calcarisporiella thermophila]|uniref:uncharacterized protein n=1 Tax=Calcarisporiella thermophila TaxID=911321 RepID=UPI003742E7E1
MPTHELPIDGPYSNRFRHFQSSSLSTATKQTSSFAGGKSPSTPTSPDFATGIKRTSSMHRQLPQRSSTDYHRQRSISMIASSSTGNLHETVSTPPPPPQPRENGRLSAGSYRGISTSSASLRSYASPLLERRDSMPPSYMERTNQEATPPPSRLSTASLSMEPQHERGGRLFINTDLARKRHSLRTDGLFAERRFESEDVRSERMTRTPTSMSSRPPSSRDHYAPVTSPLRHRTSSIPATLNLSLTPLLRSSATTPTPSNPSPDRGGIGGSGEKSHSPVSVTSASSSMYQFSPRVATKMQEYAERESQRSVELQSLLQETRDYYTNCVKGLQQQVRDQANLTAAKEKDVQQLRDEIRTLRRRLKEETRGGERLGKEREELSGRVEEMRLRVELLAREKEALEARVQELEAELVGLRSEEVGRSGRDAEVRQRTEVFARENEKLRRELEDAEEEIQDLQATVDAEINRRVRAEQEREETRRALHHAEQENARLEGIVEGIERDLGKLPQQALPLLEKISGAGRQVPGDEMADSGLGTSPPPPSNSTSPMPSAALHRSIQHHQHHTDPNMHLSHDELVERNRRLEVELNATNDALANKVEEQQALRREVQELRQRLVELEEAAAVTEAMSGSKSGTEKGERSGGEPQKQPPMDIERIWVEKYMELQREHLHMVNLLRDAYDARDRARTEAMVWRDRFEALAGKQRGQQPQSQGYSTPQDVRQRLASGSSGRSSSMNSCLSEEDEGDKDGFMDAEDRFSPDYNRLHGQETMREERGVDEEDEDEGEEKFGSPVGEWDSEDEVDVRTTYAHRVKGKKVSLGRERPLELKDL